MPTWFSLSCRAKGKFNDLSTLAAGNKKKETEIFILTDPQRGHPSEFCSFLRRESLDEDQHLFHFLLEHDFQVFIATHQLHEHLRAQQRVLVGTSGGEYLIAFQLWLSLSVWSCCASSKTSHSTRSVTRRPGISSGTHRDTSPSRERPRAGSNEVRNV